MSTNNFTYENICVVVHEPDYYCYDCEVQTDGKCLICKKEIENEIDWNNDIQYWKDKIAKKIKGFIPVFGEKWDNNALILGEWSTNRQDGTEYANIKVTYRSGYYSGACLDYIIEYNDDEYYKNMRPETFEKRVLKTQAKISTLLKSFGVQVVRVANFSNGEAIYKKA